MRMYRPQRHILIVLASLTSCASQQEEHVGCPSSASAEACTVFNLTNQDRAAFAEESDQAEPLSWSDEIAQVAQAHAEDMCERAFFSHISPEGVGPSERAAAAGLDFPLAENIAANHHPHAAVYRWMLEPTCVGHRANILDPRAVEMGVGYVICNNPNNPALGQHHHVVQNFRLDFSRTTSPYCNNAATHCQLPPSPPSTAQCPQALINAGLCPEPYAELLAEWSCPDD